MPCSQRIPPLVLIAALAVGFATVEVSLRLFQRIANDVPVLSLLPGYRESTFQLSPFLVFGPRLDWRPAGAPPTEWSWFNTQGLRVPDTVGAKQPGEFRIVTLGGSTTEDVWNGAGLHWPLVLECALHEAGRTQVRVLNAAMSAYSSAHSLVRLATDIVEYEPDMVVVMHNINDLGVNYYALSTGGVVDHNYLVRYGRKSYTGTTDQDDVVLSRTLSAARSRLTRAPGADTEWRHGDYDVDAGARIFGRNLHSIVLLAAGRGASVVLLTMPVAASEAKHAAVRQGSLEHAGLGMLPEYAPFHRDFARYNDVIRDLAPKGARVVDMARLLEADERYFVDIVHYSSAGVLAFGQTLAPHLLDLIPAGGEAGSGDGCAWRRDPAVQAALAREHVSVHAASR
jgi:hypothetical protein